MFPKKRPEPAGGGSCYKAAKGRAPDLSPRENSSPPVTSTCTSNIPHQRPALSCSLGPPPKLSLPQALLMGHTTHWALLLQFHRLLLHSPRNLPQPLAAREPGTGLSIFLGRESAAQAPHPSLALTSWQCSPLTSSELTRGPMAQAENQPGPKEVATQGTLTMVVRGAQEGKASCSQH